MSACLTAFILTNTSWDHRPVAEEWYRSVSDPDVQSIRIVLPYITDPVLRTKLKQTVEAAMVFGDDFHRAGTFDGSTFEKISSAAAAIIFRPFM